MQSQQEKDLSDTIGNLSVFAVIDEVPEDLYPFYESIAIETRGNKYTENFVKQLWILDMVSDVEELEKFQEAIFGINSVTAKGVEESQKKFPDNDKE
jgi:hypothetical protein